MENHLPSVPAHRFLHIRGSESDGYWEFWQRQAGYIDTACLQGN